MQPEPNQSQPPIPLDYADPAVQTAEQEQQAQAQSTWSDSLSSIDLVSPALELTGPAVEVAVAIGKSGVEMVGDAIGSVFDGL